MFGSILDHINNLNYHSQTLNTPSTCCTEIDEHSIKIYSPPCRLGVGLPNRFVMGEKKRQIPITIIKYDAILTILVKHSDFLMAYATSKWAESQRLHGSAPVYRYVFDQVQLDQGAVLLADDPGAAHATDIPFVFDTLDFLGKPIL